MWNLFNQEQLYELNRKKTLEQGRLEGMAEGKEQNCIENIKSLMRKMEWTAKQAMEALEIPVSDQPKYLAMI